MRRSHLDIVHPHGAGTTCRGIVVAAVAALALVGACTDGGGSDEGKRMSFISSREYNRGYQDGMQQGEKTIFNDSGGWMWLWATKAEYRQGYERGWKDGRKVREMKKNAGELGKQQPPQVPPNSAAMAHPSQTPAGVFSRPKGSSARRSTVQQARDQKAR